MNKISKSRKWTSYVLQCFIVLFLLIGAFNNILKTEIAITNSHIFGYAETTLVPLGLFLLLGILFYVIPCTSIFGLIILTAWYGGAVATHIIHGDDFVTLLTPIVFGLVTWFALGLRDGKIQSIILLKK